MTDARKMLEGAYRDFNARRIDAVLNRMQPEVEWANGMEGGYVYGREGVREYWTRQWAIIDPHVEPVEIREQDAGKFVLDVHQVVHDREGKLLADRMVRHVYTLRDGLIQRMEIEEHAQGEKK
ncbi:MAG TPA: nuclear transport factor 2 family protein [Terracidiphilus sp.]|nr:nuclear transport factor 2 family protein [Terracidiphilus sp.]